MGDGFRRVVDTPNLDALIDQAFAFVSTIRHRIYRQPGIPDDGQSSSTNRTITQHDYGLDRIALREVTIADMFKIPDTKGLVGKWHNGTLDRRFEPNARGFDEFVGFAEDGPIITTTPAARMGSSKIPTVPI